MIDRQELEIFNIPSLCLMNSLLQWNIFLWNENVDNFCVVKLPWIVFIAHFVFFWVLFASAPATSCCKSSFSNCAKRRFSCCFSYFCSTYAASSTNSLTEISSHMLKFGSSLSMLRGKIIFKKTKNKTSGTAWHVTSFPCSILSQTIALDQSAREDSLSYILKLQA